MADTLKTQDLLDSINGLEGFEAEMVEDGENPMYLQIVNISGQAMSIYGDFTEVEFDLDSLLMAETWNERIDPWNKRDVFTEIAGSSDTLDLLKGVMRTIG